MDQNRDEPADQAMAQLVCGVGQVCIAASALEWSLAYLTGLIENWDDDKHQKVLSRPGQPLTKYRNLAPQLESSGIGSDAVQLANDAERLLADRHRVVHSVMMADNERRYEAWHAKNDTTWSVVPEDLNTLARDLALCAAEANAFAEAWKERAERDGWPTFPQS